jgi:hypothetical protein
VHALVYGGAGNKDWTTVPDPSVIDPTDAIIRIEAATICGTDLHILKGDVPEVTDGRVLGHEAVGTVVATGSAVSAVQPGERVLDSCISACGRCRYCRQALRRCCVTLPISCPCLDTSRPLVLLCHNQPPPRLLRDRRDRCWLCGLNLPVKASQTDRAQAEGRLKLPDLAKQTRSGSGLFSFSQHAGQARRRTSPAGRPSRALRGTPKRAPNLQLFSRRFAQRPLRSQTLPTLSGQRGPCWAVSEATPSLGILQWARHVLILSLLTSRYLS